jgi:dTDP-glucose 4,6-dehydratase
MRLLVTGGAGFIGSNFVNRVLSIRPDHSITVLDSLTYAGKIENLASSLDSIKFVRGDICDEKLVDELVSQTEQIVHFAAESHNDNSLLNPELFWHTNVIGTLTLAKSALKHSVRFHHISTDEVFGDLPLNSGERFSETSPYRPSSPYSASKASSDHVIRSYVRSFGLHATITNCSNNYGPNQNSEKLIPTLILAASNGQKLNLYGNGQNIRDWIHVDDHTDGVIAAIEHGAIGETYLLGASNERTNLSVALAICNHFGLTEDSINFVSDRPGHDLRYAIDASKAIRELGWQPKATHFENNIRELCNIYSSRGTK